jgi:hypothetical protein
MVLQEWDVDQRDSNVETMMLGQAWRATVAEEPCPRVTSKRLRAFYAAHIDRARALVAERLEAIK